MHEQQKINYANWSIWVFYIGLVIALTLIIPKVSIPNQHYLILGQRWLANQALYTSSHDLQFFYFPQTAWFFSLFSSWSFTLFQVVWRLVLLILLCRGLFRFAQLNPYGVQPKTFLVLSVLTFLLGIEAGAQGLLTLVTLVVMLFSTVEILDERWFINAFYLILGFAISPAVIVYLLLVRAIYRKLFFWAISLIVIAMLLPLAVKSPHYVWDQYKGIFTIFEQIRSDELQNPQLFSLLAHMHLHFFVKVQTPIRIIMGIIVYLYSLAMRTRLPKPQFCVLIYVLCAIFYTLFNPRTTYADYIVLAPILGYFISLAWYLKQKFNLFILILLTAVLLISCITALQFTPESVSWLPPVCSIILAVYSVIFFSRFTKRYENSIEHVK